MSSNDHGHGGPVISENSLQDRLLVLVALGVLGALIFTFGSWFGKFDPQQFAQPAHHGAEHGGGDSSGHAHE